MLFKLAWKNIWRNRIRSSLIVSAVAFGLAVGVLMWAFANGLQQQRLLYQLDHSIGHIKITHPDFDEEKSIQYLISDSLLAQVSSDNRKEIKAFSWRLNTYLMASSPSKQLLADVYGIVPSQEKQVFTIHQQLTQGNYLEDTNIQNPIIVGESFAQKMQLKLHQKVKLHFPTKQKSIDTISFKIVGLYHVNNPNFEANHVFVRASDFQKALHLKAHQYHQCLLRTDTHTQALTLSPRIEEDLSAYQVQSWAVIAPELAYLEEVLDYFFTIFVAVILLLLSFGLVNVMLMSVLERQYEWSMLVAIGMQHKQIFSLIVLEAMFLSSLGLFFGFLMASFLMFWSTHTGIQLAWFDAQLSDMRIYPMLDLWVYARVMLLLWVAALLSALYPAWSALKMSAKQDLK